MFDLADRVRERLSTYNNYVPILMEFPTLMGSVLGGWVCVLDVTRGG